MYDVKGFLVHKVSGYDVVGHTPIIDWRMEHIPRIGETIRIKEDEFYVVTNIVWCLDETSFHGQRVNIEFSKAQ